MKKKEKDTLRTLEKAELMQKITESQNALTKLHIEKATSQIKNSRAGRKLRLAIATVQTILKEKEFS